MQTIAQVVENLILVRFRFSFGDEVMACIDDSEMFFPAQANTIRVGQIALLQKKPCKIVQISRSQPGKHGPAKLVFVGLDVFTGKKCEDYCQAKHMMKLPEVKKNEYEVLNV